TWNGRIDVFGVDKRYLRSLPVKGWESHSTENKPYLAILPTGDILLTQPDAGHLLELNPQGTTLRTISLSTPSATGNPAASSRPIGVAVDAAGTIVVSDGVYNQVTRLPPQ
ncbi:MAG: hypothetical protein ACR2PL_10635, partial [Dehalococcoidia bacterium]